MLELVSQEKCGVVGADVQGGREIGKVGFGAAQVRTKDSREGFSAVLRTDMSSVG